MRLLLIIILLMSVSSCGKKDRVVEHSTSNIGTQPYYPPHYPAPGKPEYLPEHLECQKIGKIYICKNDKYKCTKQRFRMNIMCESADRTVDMICGYQYYNTFSFLKAKVRCRNRALRTLCVKLAHQKYFKCNFFGEGKGR
jgi:hypothetical protein